MCGAAWYIRGGELRRYFLLPDYVTRNKGQVLEPDSELLQNRGPEEAADKAGQVSGGRQRCARAVGGDDRGRGPGQCETERTR